MAGKLNITFTPRVHIDLVALAENVKELTKTISPSKLCCVVKADAYGHGMIEVSKTAENYGASCLAVATVSEGIALRQAEVKLPILVLSEASPDELEDAIIWGLTLTIISFKTFRKLLKCIESIKSRLKSNANSHPRNSDVCFGYSLKFPIEGIFGLVSGKVPIHLKLETGMSRLGGSKDELLSVINYKQDQIVIEAIWTHMATADIKGHINNPRQIDKFNSFIHILKNDFGMSFSTHMANTAASLALPQTRLDMVRSGLGVYGYYPAEWIGKSSLIKREGPVLKGVKSVKVAIENLTKISEGQGVSYGHNFVAERDTTIATIQIGYADGLFRELSKVGGEVLIRGQRCNIVGNITMNHTMIDIGHLTKRFKIERGEEVVILGKQKKETYSSNKNEKSGFSQIDADQIAKKLNTISYEVLTNLGHSCTKIFNKSAIK